jgi:hypothetical protein
MAKKLMVDKHGLSVAGFFIIEKPFILTVIMILKQKFVIFNIFN